MLWGDRTVAWLGTESRENRMEDEGRERGQEILEVARSSRSAEAGS